MVGPRPEQVVPRAVEPSALAAVDDVPGEEVVGALVLDADDEGVVLRAVVGVVEGRRDGVLVRRIGFAVRVGRHQLEVLGDAGAEAAVAGALRIAEEHPLPGRERRAIRDQHPHHGLAVSSQLRVGVQLGELVAFHGHVDHERGRLRRGEVVGADRRSRQDSCRIRVARLRRPGAASAEPAPSGSAPAGGGVSRQPARRAPVAGPPCE